MDGAISGMVQSLGDPHSISMNADKFEQLKEHTEGEFGGIGVTMGFKDSKVYDHLRPRRYAGAERR